MPLHFPNLSIFIAAVHTDAAAINTMTRIDIAGTEYEVQALISTPAYDLALRAFHHSTEQERNQSIRHAQIILAIARVDLLLSDTQHSVPNSEIPQATCDSNSEEESEEHRLKRYIDETKRSREQQQEKKEIALNLLEKGEPAEQVAKKLLVSSTTVRRWRNESKKVGRHIPYAHACRLTILEQQRLKLHCQEKSPRDCGYSVDQWNAELICSTANRIMGKTLSLATAEAFLQHMSQAQSLPSQPIQPSTPPEVTQLAKGTEQSAETITLSKARRDERAYNAEARTVILNKIVVEKRTVIDVALETGVSTPTLFRWLRAGGYSTPSRIEPLTQRQQRILQDIVRRQSPLVYRINASHWDAAAIIALSKHKLQKSLTTEQALAVLADCDISQSSTSSDASYETSTNIECAQGAAASAASTPYPSTPPQTDNWINDDDLLSWFTEESRVSSEEMVLDQQFLQQLLSEGVQDTLVPTPATSPPPQPQQPQTQPSTAPPSPSSSPDQWLPDDQLTNWLVQLESSSTPPLPVAASPVTAPISLHSSGLLQQEIEELRTALSTRTPRHYGIDASDWALEVVQRFIRQLFEKELSLGQVLDLLTEQGVPFHRTF